MTSKPTSRKAARYLLARASPPVQQAIFRDGSLTRETGLTRALSYPNGFSVDGDEFIGAIRKSLGSKTPRVLLKSTTPARPFDVSRTADGAVILRDKAISLRVDNADILSRGKKRRSTALEQALATALLPKARTTFWRDACSRPLTNDDYLAFLDETRAVPENLTENLQEPQQLNLQSLVPDDFSYFTTLLPPPPEGTSFHNYATGYLPSEHRHLLDTNLALAYERIAVQASLQTLIPFDLLPSPPPEMLDKLASRKDPLSLLFVLELVARNFSTQPTLADIGTKVLHALLGEESRLSAMADMFSACSIVAAVGLAERPEAAHLPLYWRRAAMLAHAAVLTNALSMIRKTAEFRIWAFDNLGTRFVWRVISERRVAPRWWPEWLEPATLAADIVGRATIALHPTPPEHRPTEWTSLIADAQQRLADSGRLPRLFYPSAMDDFTGINPPGDRSLFKATFAALNDALPLDQVPGIEPFVHTYGLTAEHVAQISAAARNTNLSPTCNLPTYLAVLELAGQAAVKARSEALATLVADKALHEFDNAVPESLTNLMVVIVDAANAITDQHANMRWLGNYLERLSLAAKTQQQAEVIVATIERLHGVDPLYRPYLSRARALAKLPRSWQ